MLNTVSCTFTIHKYTHINSVSISASKYDYVKEFFAERKYGTHVTYTHAKWIDVLVMSRVRQTVMLVGCESRLDTTQHKLGSNSYAQCDHFIPGKLYTVVTVTSH